MYGLTFEPCRNLIQRQERLHYGAVPNRNRNLSIALQGRSHWSGHRRDYRRILCE